MSHRKEVFPVRIACIYRRDKDYWPSLTDMSSIRFFRISESLANRGYQVDLFVGTDMPPRWFSPNFRAVPFNHPDWGAYDVIKTFFHLGFESLHDTGGNDHPFIISKLGSVVGRRVEKGVHFYGPVREKLFGIQSRITGKSRYVTILTPESIALWKREFGERDHILYVPGAVKKTIPLPSNNPYRSFKEPIILFAGNIYESQQRRVNLRWQRKLNILGYLLKKEGLRLVAIGRGFKDHIDPAAVTHLGTVPEEESWDFQYFASVGIVFAQGDKQHNESSKIYSKICTACSLC